MRNDLSHTGKYMKFWPVDDGETVHGSEPLEKIKKTPYVIALITDCKYRTPDTNQVWYTPLYMSTEDIWDWPPDWMLDTYLIESIERGRTEIYDEFPED